MTSAADVARSSPVDALVTGAERHHDVACVRRTEGGPKPLESVRVVLARNAAVAPLQLQDREVAVQVPAAPAPVGFLRSRLEAQLAAISLNDRLGSSSVPSVEARHEVHALELAKPLANADQDPVAPRSLPQRVHGRRARCWADRELG